MRKSIIILINVFLIIFLIFSSGLSAEELTTAKLLGLKGEVLVKKGGGNREFRAFENMVITQGDRVRTGVDGKAKIVYNNGSETFVNPNSQLTIQRLTKTEKGSKTTVKLFAGAVWSKVKTMLNIDNTYEIETPTVVLGARGTLYLVTIDEDGNISLDVADGAVGASGNAETSGGSTSYLIGTGNSLEMGGDGQTGGQTPIDVQSFVQSVDPSVLVQIVNDIVERAEQMTDQTQQALGQVTNQQNAVTALQNAVRASELAGLAQQVVQTAEQTTANNLSERFQQELQSNNQNLNSLRQNIQQQAQRTQSLNQQVQQKAEETGLSKDEVENVVSNIVNATVGSQGTNPPLSSTIGDSSVPTSNPPSGNPNNSGDNGGDDGGDNGGDYTPPPPAYPVLQAVAADPLNQAAGVFVDKTLSVSFNAELVEDSQFSSIQLEADGGTAVPANISIGNPDRTRLIIDPANDLILGEDYVLTIPAGSVKSLAGSPLSADFTVNFKTINATPVVVTGDLVSGTTTWTRTNSPYLVSNSICIYPGAALYIESGVVVKFDTAAGIKIEGQLFAMGEHNNQIYFTDYRDDSIGGDTNGDGASSPMAWEGIQVIDGGSGSFSNCIFSYGGSSTTGGSQDTLLYKIGSGDFTLADSVITNTPCGVKIGESSGNDSVRDCTISADTGMIVLAGSSPNIVRNTITGVQYGLMVNSAAPTVKDNTLTAEYMYGMEIDGDFTGTWPVISGNTFDKVHLIGNATGVPFEADNEYDDPFYIGGSITGDVTWSDDRVYLLNSDLEVKETGSLTVSPGTVIKAEPDKALFIWGGLKAKGTTAEPIYFTDFADDTIGGDTNKDGSASSPAGWGGIKIGNINLGYTSSTAAIEQAVIRYASRPTEGPSVIKEGNGDFSLQHSIISDSPMGVLIQQSKGTDIVSSCTIEAAVGIVARDVCNPAISNNEVSAQDIGLRIWNAKPTVTGNDLVGVRYGLEVVGEFSSEVGGFPTISQNTINKILLVGDGAGVSIADDNTCSEHIYLEGFISTSIALDNNWVYCIKPGLTIKNEGTLVVSPGQVLKFTEEAYLQVETGGLLYASGTSDNPIYFTDYRDDAHGGDSNNDGTATSPAEGSWQGILFNGGIVIVDNCEILYQHYGTIG